MREAYLKILDEKNLKKDQNKISNLKPGPKQKSSKTA